MAHSDHPGLITMTRYYRSYPKTHHRAGLRPRRKGKKPPHRFLGRTKRMVAAQKPSTTPDSLHDSRAVHRRRAVTTATRVRKEDGPGTSALRRQAKEAGRLLLRRRRTPHVAAVRQSPPSIRERGTTPTLLANRRSSSRHLERVQKPAGLTTHAPRQRALSFQSKHGEVRTLPVVHHGLRQRA